MKQIVKVLCVMLVMPVLASGSGEGHGHGYDAGYLIPQIVNFLVFFGGLGYILKKPVSEFFAGRQSGIRHSLELAEKSREEAKRQLDEIDAKSANLDTELADIHAQAKADVAREKERLLVLARSEAEKIREQAKLDVTNLGHEAKRELKIFLADLAVKEAEKMVRETMSEEERKQLFVDFTARLGAQS